MSRAGLLLLLSMKSDIPSGFKMSLVTCFVSGSRKSGRPQVQAISPSNMIKNTDHCQPDNYGTITATEKDQPKTPPKRPPSEPKDHNKQPICFRPSQALPVPEIPSF